MIIAYTDGSANWKNGLGGAGAFIKYPNGEEDSISKGYSQTKTGRMEITALLETILLVPENSSLKVYSDSQYVVRTFTEGRLQKWKARGFSMIKNPDLWELVSDAIELKGIHLSIEHIKGHQKVVDEHTEGNFFADSLADYKNFSDDEREKDIPDEDWEFEKSNKES